MRPQAVLVRDRRAGSWLSAAEVEQRNERILELWALGASRAVIAREVDLTPQRISQIVNSFGCGWR